MSAVLTPACTLYASTMAADHLCGLWLVPGMQDAACAFSPGAGSFLSIITCSLTKYDGLAVACRLSAGNAAFINKKKPVTCEIKM